METMYSSKEAVDQILKAHRNGRPIVWFLGSGISISAGFPGIQSICSYLAHLQFAISEGLFGHRHLSLALSQDEAAQTKPSRTIELYGWPSPERLTSDMWRWLQRGDGTTPDSLQFHKTWSHFVVEKQLYRNHSRTVEESKLDIEKYAASIPMAQWLKSIESVVFLSELADRIDANLAQQVFSKAIRGGKFKLEDSDSTWIRGDWSQLLDTLTEGRSDFVDALFVALGSGRIPSATHVLLAAISRAFGSRLALTTNFDSLFEQAAQDAGFTPQVFDVSTDASVPHPILVRPRFSIVKLHGSNFGLRVGERLQSALDDDTKNKILGYMDPESLIVVLGFSGWERRMMQLLESWAVTSANEATDHKERIVWLHFETSSTPCEQMKARLKSRNVDPELAVKTRRIQDAETFLSSLYFRYSSAFPASATGYEYLSPARISPVSTDVKLKEQIVTLFSDSKSDLLFHRSSAKKSEKIWRKYNAGPNEKPRSVHVATDSSVRLAAFAASFRTSHTTIWVDLEPHHTVQGVVCEILNRMRVFDPQLPTLHFPASAFLEPEESRGEIEAEFAKARERIIEAMVRRTYIICFDRLEGFARPQTVHHGTPSAPENDFEESEQLELLCDFLIQLCGDYKKQGAIGNGRFAFSVDVPRSRHFANDDSSPPPEIWARCYRQVSDFVSRLGKLKPTICTATQVVVGSKETLSPKVEEILSREGIESPAELVKKIVKPPPLFEITLGLARNRSGGKNSLDTSDTFSVLALLRRPRSIVTVRSVLGTHIARTVDSESGEKLLRETFQQIDDVIEVLAETGLAYCLEGEKIWLPSLLHESVYKRLTEFARERNIARLLKLSDKRFLEEAPIGKWLDLLSLVYWHRRFSRHFYSGVYLPTKDPNSFWEYCYHRVSALRYLTAAHALAYRYSQMTGSVLPGQSPDPKDPFFEEDEEGQWVVEFSGRLELLDILKSKDVTHWSKIGPQIWQQISCKLGMARQRQLDAFTETICREREYLFSVVPPETLAGWCRQLRDKDLFAITGKRLCDRIRKNFQEHLYSGTVVINGFRPLTIAASAAHLSYELTQLISVVTFLRRDFKRSHAAVWGSNEKVSAKVVSDVIKQLKVGVGNGLPKGLVPVEVFYQLVEKALGLRVSAGVNISNISHELALAAWDSDGVSEWFQSECKRSPEKFALKIAQTVSALRRSAISKAQLGQRAFSDVLMAAAERLADETLAYYEKLTTDLDQPNLHDPTAKIARQKLSNLRRRIDLYLLRLPLWGGFDRMTDERPQFTESAANSLLSLAGTASRKLEELARESAVISSNDYFEYRCDSLATLARVECLKAHFINCHRLLDRATAGLTESPRHMVFHAITSMYRAEACALSAATSLSDVRRLNRASRTSIRDRVSHARDLLRRSREALAHAEGCLAGGRRDLSAWIDLYLGRGQIGFETLLIEVSCFDMVDAWDVAWSHDLFAAGVERQLDEALWAVRAALDTIPYRKEITFKQACAEPQHQRELKALALWCQVMVLGDFVLRLARVKAASHEFPGVTADDSPKQWAANFGRLNTSFSEKDELHAYVEFFTELCSSMRFDDFAALLNNDASKRVLIPAMKDTRQLITGETKCRNDTLLRAELLDRIGQIVEESLPLLWTRRH